MADTGVLVVEDDPEINDLVGAYVELAGYHYLRALTGKDALRQAADAHPALIVLDLMLPDLDGFEVCRQLKRDPATAHIPVVMLTALDRDDSRQKGLQLGACSYLTKPFDPDTLMETIRHRATSAASDGAR